MSVRFANTGAVVLAGGASRRMGRDKCFLKLGGEVLLDQILRQLEPHFDELLVSRAREDSWQPPEGVRLVYDRLPGRGPLMGLSSALMAASYEVNFVVACDIPNIDLDLVARLIELSPGLDAVVPRRAGGHIEPLFAVYRRSISSSIERALATGRGQMRAAYQEGRVAYLDLHADSVLENLNTPEDYERFLKCRDR